jgi:Zn-dependent M16 (insulinase) family peptidase
VGVGKRSYLEQQEHLYASTGGLSASSTLRSLPNHEGMAAYFTLSGKALARNHETLSSSLQELWRQVRFDEADRIKDMLSQAAIRRESSITQQGHGLAMQAAASGLSIGAWLSHELSGLPSIQRLKSSVAERGFEERVIQSFEGIQAVLLGHTPEHYLFVNEPELSKECHQQVRKLWSEVTDRPIAVKGFTCDMAPKKENTAWLTNTQVHFCAKAFATVSAVHPDAAPLTVLGGYLRNGFLHRAIREQGGAYGGGATHDLAAGVFKFYSYRDPRLSGTLEDFDASIRWLLETKHETEKLEQAILGVISSLDKPASPAGEAKQDFHYRLTGRMPEFRQRFREQVLSTRLEDLQRVAESYLKPELSQVAIVSHAGARNELEALGLSLYEI